ncbi:hypothetical protein BaRGS_00001411 [Batillaria attramentaria]|uniref:Uncharacterized protein n=1 Tax=Batillaria attramentaria TaxID=370345 RepID=A0ABD0M740_9CAEN
MYDLLIHKQQILQQLLMPFWQADFVLAYSSDNQAHTFASVASRKKTAMNKLMPRQISNHWLETGLSTPSISTVLMFPTPVIMLSFALCFFLSSWAFCKENVQPAI